MCSASTDVSIPPVPASAPADARIGLSERLGAGGLAAACLGTLIFAATLSPDPSGMGTHQQLGLPPCPWLVIYNLPCPTCGMTTSFACIAHGRILDGFVAQPAGAVMAIGTAVVFWFALHAAATGSTILRALWRQLGRWLGPGIALLLIGGWAYTLVRHSWA